MPVFSGARYRHTPREARYDIQAVVVRNSAGSGSTLISSGFPLPPGLVTEDMIRQGTIRIYVNGSEVAANVTGLRGRHRDGTLRSILIQFTRTMSQGDTATATVVVGSYPRAYSDPAYVRPIWQMVSDNNVILPTDTAYLCSTLLCGRYLLPAGQGSVAEEKQYTALADNQFDNAVAVSNAQLGLTPPVDSRYGDPAYYEPLSAILGMFCRTGNLKYQREAVLHILKILPYNTPTPATAGSEAAVINPDSRTDGTNTVHGLPNEQHGPMSFSYAQMYLMTGYRDFWGLVSFLAQYNQVGITSQSVANTNVIARGNYDTPRANYSSRYGMMLAALQVDATIPVTVPHFFAGRFMDFTDQLDWTINAIVNTAWDLKWIPYTGGTGTIPTYGATISQGGVTATFRAVGSQRFAPYAFAGDPMPATGYIQVRDISGGPFSAGALTGIGATATGPEESDYRQGLTGCRSDSWIVPNSPPATYIPIFQFTFVSNFLIDYYLHYKRDSRIPGLVKTMLDVLLSNIRVMRPGDSQYGKTNITWGNPIYGKPYNLEDPVNTTADAPCYELPEYARMLAFVVKTIGDDTVNGASYSTWYSRVIDTANIAPPNVFVQIWKNFGQFYAWCLDAPWMQSQSSLQDYGPSVMREPTLYLTIPGDVPDLARS